ncbi:MAG: PBECR2 nuclease fold domain-containing protein [Phascolarctobacterium sp.]|uniref:PBECR2 nuclease fold domain-containing protein n=1 Tax=Phascolarctobacterium sp. TaxID=2049039 RepID=UPI0026DC52A9|nr:PBECR2 nuclease fold domain-containing protein [Phascolarctobacterium sp.]MDO4920833.1 PBECR2 nuclease fold domain-containing protein [Phascolarctobacterium sp.]
MYFVGRIDREIYKCIAEDIVTDEVVITDNQIQHIRERHLDAYEQAVKLLYAAIADPDYIIRDKHPNSGLIIKRIKTETSYIQLVLRICTESDAPNYKNSIISCWKISENRLNNYLRNKEILYRKL